LVVGKTTAVRPNLDAKPAAKEAAEDVARQVSDEDSQAALRSQLRKLLIDDPSLRETIASLVREGERNRAGYGKWLAKGGYWWKRQRYHRDRRSQPDLSIGNTRAGGVGIG
jgi:hypothetical protein